MLVSSYPKQEIFQVLFVADIDILMAIGRVLRPSP